MSFRLTAIALAVLALLSGVIWFFEFRDKDKSDSAEAKPDKQALLIFKFEDSDTSGLEVAKPEALVQMVRAEGGAWTIQPAGLPGDRVRISSVLLRLTNLQATRRVGDAPSDLAQYGLDNPALTASVTMMDGATHVLQTGARVPTDAGTYAKKAGDGAVFLIPNQLVTDLDRLVTQPPIEQPTPTPAPIPSPPPSPETAPTPGG